MKALALGIWLAATSALAAPLGDDGLHKPDWLHEGFLDLREDLAEASATGKRLLITIEQRGCIYCAKMHEEVFPDPEVDRRLREKFTVVQINLAGSLEVTDLDGTRATEKAMAAKWAVNFTPTLMFLPQEVPADQTARQAAVVVLPGSPEAQSLTGIMDWVLAGGLESGRTMKDFLADR